MNPFKKLLGQTAVYGLSSILGRTLNYLLVPIYTSKMMPAEYGVLSQLYALVAFLMVLLTFGMETTFFRFIQDEKDQSKVFRNSLVTVGGMNILFLLIILFFNQGFANLLLMPGDNNYIILLGLVVVIDAISSIPLAKLRAEENAKKFALIQFTSIGVNIVLNVVFMYGLYDETLPEQGIMFILIANLISSLVKPLMLYKDFIDVKWRLDVALAAKMFRYAFPIVIAGFAGIVNETLDRIMLKQILAEQKGINFADTQIGIYSACYKLAMLVTILLQAYRYAAEPFFFNQMKNDDKNRIYIRLMNYFVAAMCIVFLVVSLNLDFFKYFISNDAYWIGLRVVPVLLMANVFLGIYFNQSIWYKLTNRTKFGAYIAIGGATLTIVLNYTFIPKYGYMASAWATFIVYAAQMVASYILGQRFYPIRYNLRKFTLYLLVTGLIYITTQIIDLESGSVLQFFIHNIFVVAFAGLVLFIEGISFRKPQKLSM